MSAQGSLLQDSFVDSQKVMLCQIIPEMSDIGCSMLCKLAFPIRVGD